jgi:hypothetical protein
MNQVEEVSNIVMVQETEATTETLSGRYNVTSLPPQFQDVEPGSSRETAAVQYVM